MDVLEASGIIYILPPYFPRNLGKRIIKAPKVYFLETGLLMREQSCRVPCIRIDSALFS